MQRLKPLLLVLIAIIFVFYVNSALTRKNAVFHETSVSPNKLYRIDKYFINSSDSTVLFRIYNKERELVGEYMRHNYIGHPTLRHNWECGKDSCTEYWWGSGDDDRIMLPPNWFEQLRAKLP